MSGTDVYGFGQDEYWISSDRSLNGIPVRPDILHHGYAEVIKVYSRAYRHIFRPLYWRKWFLSGGMESLRPLIFSCIRADLSRVKEIWNHPWIRPPK